MKKLLITGGSGFIGQNFIRKNYNKYKILNIDCLSYSSDRSFHKNLKSCVYFEKINLNDNKKLQSKLSVYDPDIIVNFASHSHVDKSIANSELFLENIVGTFNLLTYVKNHKQRKKINFLQISTDEVFGSFKGKDFSLASNYDPSSPYSASKASSDHLVSSFAKTFGIKTAICYSCNNYGPYQFLEKLIPLTIFNFLNKKKIGIYGNGLQSRQWIYVEDNIAAIKKILESDFNNQRYFIGSKNKLTNLELIKMLLDKLNKKTFQFPKFNYLDYVDFVKDRPGHDLHYSMNPKDFCKQFNWKEIYSLESGIDKTVEWYLQNLKWVKKQARFLENFRF